MEGLLNLVSDVVENAAVILVILGLVEYLRLVGLRDIPLRVASMLMGILFGSGAIVSEQGMPVDFSGGFYVLLAGVLFGLIASGVVDLSGRLISKNVAEANEDPQGAIDAAE